MSKEERGDGSGKLPQAAATPHISPDRRVRMSESQHPPAECTATTRVGSLLELEERVQSKIFQKSSDDKDESKVRLQDKADAQPQTDRENLKDIENRVMEKATSQCEGSATATPSSNVPAKADANRSPKKPMEGGETNLESNPSTPSTVLDGHHEMIDTIAPFPSREIHRHTTPQPGAYAEAGPPVFRSPETIHSQDELEDLEEGMQPNDYNSNLAVARPVAGDATLELPRGVEESRKGRLAIETSERETRWMTLGLVLLCLALIAGAALIATHVTSSPDDVIFATAESITASPSGAPTLGPQDQVLELLSGDTVKRVKEDGTPQHRAFQWLVGDPMLKTYPEVRLLQRFALATFYYATAGHNWNYNTASLNYTQHECFWYSSGGFDLDGVDFYFHETHPNPCEEDPEGPAATGAIRHLWLRTNNLEGRIPPELFLLTSLRTINVRSNDISGTIPSRIGQLTNLELLALQGNRLRGTLPTEIGLISNAVGIWLTFNQLEGTIIIPPEISNLEHTLVHFMLDSNLLTGTIPTFLPSLRKLDELLIGDNVFTGTIHTELGLLSNMVDFGLGQNQLTGAIPSELGLLLNMLIFELFQNQLTGTIPSELGLLWNVFSFGLDQIN